MIFIGNFFLISTKESLYLRKTFWTTLKANSFYETKKLLLCFVACFLPDCHALCLFHVSKDMHTSSSPKSNLVASQLPTSFLLYR